jgi:signal transduction histidine kinase
VVPGPTSEAVLIQRGGDEILFLSRLRHRADAPLTLRLPVGSAPFAARLALEGKEDFGAFVDYRGVPVLAAVRRLKSAPWGLVVKVDEDEALAPFRKNALESAITGSALLLGLFASAAGFWGALAARGEAEVARSEAREAAGIRTLNAELEERVVERTAQFEAANKELEAFSYSVSHDLRAPLRAVDGFSRILLEDHGEQLDAEGKRLLGVVRSSTRQMGQLIDDLLAFSRVGRKEIAKSDVDMAALASLAFEAQCAEGDDVSFAVGELPHVDVDLPLMRQVWTNLISNSLKFTRPKAKRVIAVAGRTEPGRVVYSVKDNGVGFDMAYTDKLFGVFQRLHSSAEFEGTGVGLALVQRIVHRHGGEVWAEGKVGEGATFSFSLPRLGGSS